MTKLITVFSEYEIKNSAIKINNGTDTGFKKVGCVGKIEEALDCITVTKKCEGVVKKTVTRGAGTGESKITLHMNYNLYIQIFGMDDENLLDGVYGYGTNSRHREFTYVGEVMDEDGNIKYKAYPKCAVKTGPSNTIENGGEEVQEIEVTFSLYPDDYGYCEYEAPAIELDDTTKGKWMTEFTPELLRKTTSKSQSQSEGTV